MSGFLVLRTPKEDQNQRGTFYRSFPGVKKGEIKWEMKRGRVVGEGTGPKGERGGKDEGERVGRKGSESPLEKL